MTRALAGKSTLNRLELTPEGNGEDRYKRIVYDAAAIDRFLVSAFLQSYAKSPERIVLDLDTTDDEIHGGQEGDLVTVVIPRELKDPKDPTKTYTTTWFDMWRFKDGKADEDWDPQAKN